MSEKKMTLFEGLAWLYANPSKVLDVNRVGYPKFSAKVSGNSLISSRQKDSAWVSWKPDVDDHLEYTFTFPARKMPELPDGDRWAIINEQTVIIGKDGITYGMGQGESCEWYRAQSLRYKALVEEFETRPKL